MVPLKHCKMEFIKHVLPRFLRPVVPIITFPTCENELSDIGAVRYVFEGGGDAVWTSYKLEGLGGSGGALSEVAKS